MSSLCCFLLVFYYLIVSVPFGNVDICEHVPCDVQDNLYRVSAGGFVGAPFIF